MDNLLATDFEEQAETLIVFKELNRERLARLIFPQALPRMRTHKAIKERSGAATESETRRLLRAVDLAIMIMEQRHWKVTHSGRLADVIDEEPSLELPAIREPLPELFWRHSPTQIKGRWRHCNENLSINDHAKRLLEHLYGRKKQRFTPKKLDACFDRIPLRRVRVRLQEPAG